MKSDKYEYQYDLRVYTESELSTEDRAQIIHRFGKLLQYGTYTGDYFVEISGVTPIEDRD